MSDAPTPHSVSPSSLGASFPPAGTVSRWPARTRRWPWPSVVRAMTLSPTRSTLEPGAGRAARPRRGRRAPPRPGSARGRPSGPGWPRGDRPPDQVLAPWSRRTWVSCALSWRSPSPSRLITRTHGTKNSPPGYSRRRLARMATHHDGTTPREISSPVSASITGMEGSRKLRRQHGALADPRPAGHHAAAADEGVVLDDDGHGIGRLEHAADAHAARQVHPLADLGARGDRGPGVDHGVRPDPGADVHVGGHEHHAAAEERAPAGRGARAGRARPPRRSRA